MPRADAIHYNLLTSALEHYTYAVEVESIAGTAERMKETARRSLGRVREAAMLAGDHNLAVLCDSAEKTLGKA